MRFPRERLRAPLACLALGSLSIAYSGLYLARSVASAAPLTVAELGGMSLPWTVAWFSFSGACMLSDAQQGWAGALASLTQLLGRAAFVAGIPVWTYWYLDLVFGVI